MYGNSSPSLVSSTSREIQLAHAGAGNRLSTIRVAYFVSGIPHRACSSTRVLCFPEVLKILVLSAGTVPCFTGPGSRRYL
jgi:hypothetical protein